MDHHQANIYKNVIMLVHIVQKVNFMGSNLYSLVVIFVNIVVIMAFGCTIYFLTAIGLTPGGSSTVHISTQTIHRTTH
jgi:hypothetical protein